MNIDFWDLLFLLFWIAAWYGAIKKSDQPLLLTLSVVIVVLLTYLGGMYD